MNLSTKAIAEIFNCEPWSVSRRAMREGWVAEPRPGRGGGNLWSVESMPVETRNKIYAYTNLANISQLNIAQSINQAEIAYQAQQEAIKQAGLARFKSLADHHQALANARAGLLKSLENFTRLHGYKATKARAEFTRLYNAGHLELAPGIKNLIPTVCARTLARWQEDFKQGGLAALGGRRANSGRKGWQKQIPEIHDFVIGMLAEFPHATNDLIQDGIAARFKCQVPIRTLQHWLAKFKVDNEPLLTALNNPDEWRSKYRAAIGNASQHITRLNQVWEIDSTPTDVILIDNKRHNIVGIIDVYSRRVIFHISRTSTSEAVAACLRKAILAWGVPEVLVTDNGKDYTSNHIKAVLDGLNITHIAVPPFTPEAKPHIERVFHTFSHGLFTLQPGFIGHNVAMRKAIEARKSFASRLCKRDKNGQKKPPIEMKASPETLQAFCDDWASNIYQHKAHSGLNRLTPWQKAASWDKPVTRIQNERALDILLAQVAGERIVGKKGIRLGNDYYVSPALAGYEGAAVKLAYDDNDAAAVYVFTLEGEFIAHAINPNMWEGLNRAQLADMVKNAQRTYYSEGVKALKRKAKKINAKNILPEIMEHKAAQAGKLRSLPKCGNTYTTPALEQAAIAASLQDAPQPEPLKPEYKAALERVEARQAAEVLPMRETPGNRYRRWLSIERLINMNALVSQQDRDFHETYQLSSEYKAMCEREEETLAMGNE